MEQLVLSYFKHLPEALQLEVLHYVQYLLQIKSRSQPDTGSVEDFATWRHQFLLDAAHGLNAIYAEDEPEYNELDLLEINPAFQPNWYGGR